MGRSTDTQLGLLLGAIERELPAAVELRRRLHERPELAHAEHETAAAIAEALPVECIADTGTSRIAKVGHLRGSAVAVRAELDGVPVMERSDVPFRSRRPVMHACGHDVHMAALVALARAAHTLGEELPAPLLAVFQASEEAYPSGAQQLAEGELLKIAPAAIVAAHIHPELPWGGVALDVGVVNASCDAIEISVEGEPTHGAYPHRGRDPVLTLCQIVVALHAQIGRRIDPLAPAVLTVGVVEAEGAENVIPPSARARGALRAHRQEDRIALRAMVEEVVHGVAAAGGCRARVELTEGEPPLQNDPEIVRRGRELMGAVHLRPVPEWRSCGSDDFAFFRALAPVAIAFVGLDGADGFQRRPLHHPELLPPDEAVGAVARVQALLYVAAAHVLAADPDRDGVE